MGLELKSLMRASKVVWHHTAAARSAAVQSRADARSLSSLRLVMAASRRSLNFNCMWGMELIQWKSHDSLRLESQDRKSCQISLARDQGTADREPQSCSMSLSKGSHMALWNAEGVGGGERHLEGLS